MSKEPALCVNFYNFSSKISLTNYLKSLVQCLNSVNTDGDWNFWNELVNYVKSISDKTGCSRKILPVITRLSTDRKTNNFDTSHNISNNNRYNRGGSRNFWLGGSKLWFRKDCCTLMRQITFSHLRPLPPVAVVRYNSLAAYRLLGFYSLRIHPWNIPLLVFGYKNCTDFININVRVCKCMSGSPDNR